MSMKILHIGKYFYPFQGGIENTMLALMRSQKALGHNVSACVHQHDANETNRYEQFEGISIFRLSVMFTLVFMPISIKAFSMMTNIIRAQSPNVLHLHLPNATCFWLLLSIRARRIPWVVHWHSDVLGERAVWQIKILYPIYAIFEKWLLGRAAAIIVTSPNYLNTSRPLQRWRHKCKIVPLCIDLTQFEDLDSKKELEKPESPLRLVCIGRLTYYKGHEYLIEAIEYANNSGVPCHLDIVGTGERQKELLQQVGTKNISKNITFHGNLRSQELSKVMSSSDALCLPSTERTEAFGLVLLEAMKFKLPCIVTDVPGSGMSYVVQNERTGLVVERASVMSLARAILRLANAPTLRKSMGEAGRQRVVKHFSVDIVSQAIIRIYSGVV